MLRYNDLDRFYYKKIERINKLIEQWQEFWKVDLLTFGKEDEELFSAEKATAKGPFWILDCPYIVKERYSEKN